LNRRPIVWKRLRRLLRRALVRAISSCVAWEKWMIRSLCMVVSGGGR
jgi:hypothetical protein